MKRKMITTLLSSLALGTAAITLVFVVRAWYTKVAKVSTINAETKDVSFVYRINKTEGEDYNPEKFEVYNLAFFDIDDSKETKYLKSMATQVTINLENILDYEVTYTITYTSADPVEVKDKSDKVLSHAYCEGILSDNSSLETDIKAYETEKGESISTINELVAADEDGNVSVHTLTGTLSATETKVVYLYLFGVQTVDTALNTMFLYSVDNDDNRTYMTYDFTLGITAINNAVVSEDEITTTTNTTTSADE